MVAMNESSGHSKSPSLRMHFIAVCVPGVVYGERERESSYACDDEDIAADVE